MATKVLITLHITRTGIRRLDHFRSPVCTRIRLFIDKQLWVPNVSPPYRPLWPGAMERQVVSGTIPSSPQAAVPRPSSGSCGLHPPTPSPPDGTTQRSRMPQTQSAGSRWHFRWEETTRLSCLSNLLCNLVCQPTVQWSPQLLGTASRHIVCHER
jgi:hypothetical protein